MAKVTLNREKIYRAAAAALNDTADELSPLFDEAIEAQIYIWPRETVRANKKTVFSPRDIKDLGTLLKSKEKIKISSTHIQFSWDPVSEDGYRYALVNHNGGTTGSNGERVISRPPRPWTIVALNRFNFLPRYSDNLGKRLP